MKLEPPGGDLMMAFNTGSYAALHQGLTQPGAPVGGGHAGYQVYACKDGRVAVAALEPHFAARLCKAAGLWPIDHNTMLAPVTRQAITAWLLGKTRKQLDRLAVEKDIPLHTLPA